MSEKRTKADRLLRIIDRTERLNARSEETVIETEQPEERGFGSPDPIPLEKDIRRRAYELYEARGREKGHELDDWLEAEGQIRRSARKGAA